MMNQKIFIAILLSVFAFSCKQQAGLNRKVEKFTTDWKFHPGDVVDGQNPLLDDSDWRVLNLPHDWSIEGEFSPEHPATPGGGALPGGLGWYRKSFTLPEFENKKVFFIDFDGIYCNSEVWINGQYLGFRPNGYISFRYELTPYLNFGDEKNVIAVKVDNSQQPNSRWYSGSGIYRNVWLVSTGAVHVDHWGTYITTPEVNNTVAKVEVQTILRNMFPENLPIILETTLYDPNGKNVGSQATHLNIAENTKMSNTLDFTVNNPLLWNVDNPYLYSAITLVKADGEVLDNYETTFGIRYFEFDSEKGFSLNGESMKILGVCNHHDLGALGAAVNTRALERQLEILKKMGCNGIRTAHNPPTPELLELCDRMGFIVQNEMFDAWRMNKTPYGYHEHFDEWYERDLTDFILRDRNHPSVIMWSIGNEILEQWDTTGISLTKELVDIIKNLDQTRPVTAGLNDPRPHNNMVKAGALDMIGFNYHHEEFKYFPENFPGEVFLASETTSALATRGSYDMPSDSIRRWPKRWDLPFHDGNPDNTCSSYDNCSAPWGSTHIETWKEIKKYDFTSGMYIWTGFDYLGEPTPYSWPSRSSYFGIVDLAGFPKDAYYLYMSEWTDEPVLHVFPHWNWEGKEGEIIDVWVYTNSAEVELFLNEESLGSKTNADDIFKFVWPVKYQAGSIKAIGKWVDGTIVESEINTAGKPAGMVLSPDRTAIMANGEDLSFITVEIIDKAGNIVPYANNLVEFEIQGNGFIAAVDNGSQTSHEPFKANYRKAFNGKCLVIVQSTNDSGKIVLTAKSEALDGATVIIESKK